MPARLYSQRWYHQVRQSRSNPVLILLIGSFFAILIQGFGFETEQTLLLGMVQACNAFAYFTFLWLGDKYKLRCLMSTVPSTLSTFGVLLVWLLPDRMVVGRLIGFIL